VGEKRGNKFGANMSRPGGKKGSIKRPSGVSKRQVVQTKSAFGHDLNGECRDGGTDARGKKKKKKKKEFFGWDKTGKKE